MKKTADQGKEKCNSDQLFYTDHKHTKRLNRMLCNQTTQDRMRIMSRFVRLKSILFNLSCVFFIFFFFRTLAGNSVSDFFSSLHWKVYIYFATTNKHYPRTDMQCTFLWQSYNPLLSINTIQDLTCSLLFRCAEPRKSEIAMNRNS